MLSVSLLLAGCGEPKAEEARLEKLVAVGDLHGDLDAALDVLRMAGLVDDAGAWSGGTATLVQTGDTTDRGPQSKEVVELMKRLVDEADAAGGRVVPLLGNHEVMNLQGDWRYVHPDDVAGFGGVEERKAELAPDGDLGAWLRTLDVVAVVDGVVFTHGGVSRQAAALGLDHWNAQVSGLVYGARPGLSDPASPIWYRGYLQDPEAEACATLSRALTALSAERMVVGHTTQDSGRVAERCDGRILGIDTGISAHYGGHLAAVEFRSGDAWAIYPSGAVDLADPQR